MKKFLFIYVIILFYSCNDAVQKPDLLLEEEVMEQILYDVSIIQAAQTIRPKVLLDNNIKYSEYVFKKYKIDSATYIQNYKYYASDIETFKNMYKRINQKMENNKVEIDSALVKGKKEFQEAISKENAVIN